MHKFNRGVKRRLSILLLFIMIFMQPVYAMTPKLSEAHWAYGTMMELVRAKVFSPMTTEWGLDEPITRQEFVRLINKAYGNKILGNVSFTDVSEDSLYYKDVAKAVASGMISGYPDGTFKPEATITRQEAATVLATMSRKENVMTGVVSAFSDGSQIPNWSKENMAWMIQKSFMKGYRDGTIGYDKTITYAEALAVTKNILGSKIVTASIDGNGQTIIGNVSVIEPDVKLSNMVITGDLMIGGQVGEGDVTLDNVEIKGRLLVYGGGQNSIHLFNSIVSQLVVSRFEAPVRIVSDANSQVRDSVIETSSVLEAPPSANVFKSVIVQPKIVNMAIDLKGTFENIAVNNIQQQLASAGVESTLPVKINIPLGSIIKTLRVATKAEIAGSGQVQNADVQVNDVKVNVKTNSFTLGNGVTKVVVNNKTVSSVSEANSAGSSTSGTTSGTTSSSSGGGSSSSRDNNDDNTTTPVTTTSPGSIEFDNIGYYATEGDTIVLTLVRSNGTDGEVSVTLGIDSEAGSTAESGDYTLTLPQTVTFANGVDEVTVSMPTNVDTDTDDERLYLVITNPTGGASIGDQDFADVDIFEPGTITSGAGIRFNMTLDTIDEGETAHLTMERSDTSEAVTVDYTIIPGTATTADYEVPTSLQVSFVQGVSTAEITINTTDDSVIDSPDEKSFSVRLDSASGSEEVSSTYNTANVNICDDDMEFEFEVYTDTVDEGTNIVLTVNRWGVVEGTASVDYATSNSAAEAGSDYTAASGTLNFAALEDSKTITIVTLSDTIPDDGENFVVTLSNPTASSTYEASLGDYYTENIIINDVAPANLVLNGITYHNDTWIEANFDMNIVDTLTTPSAVAVTSGASLITSGASIVTTDSAIEITDLTRNTLNHNQLSISFSRDAEHGMEITFYSIIESETGVTLGEDKTYIFNANTQAWGLVTN